jgi:REP-associated tyrosine transposase
MPAPPRDCAPGLHHVWVNATDPWAYFVDDSDRMLWIRRLFRTLVKLDWTCVAFCQMTTHVHVLLEVRDWSLPAGMESLNREYSKDFNALHARSGRFQKRRYGSRRLLDGRDLLAVYAYIVLNPVREKMCPRAEDWRWSSYATTLGLSADFPFVDASIVLDELDGSVEALRAFVRARQRELLADRFGHVR